MEQTLASAEQYKEFTESSIWTDLKLFFQECLTVNRDLLEGVRSFTDESKKESMDSIRGRCWQIRDILAYVEERANPPEELS